MRPVVAELRRRFEVAVAEAGHLDLHRRALIGVAVVAADAGHCHRVLDACERLVAERPELDLLSARRRLVGPDATHARRTTHDARSRHGPCPSGPTAHDGRWTTWPTAPAPASSPTASR